MYGFIVLLLLLLFKLYFLNIKKFLVAIVSVFINISSFNNNSVYYKVSLCINNNFYGMFKP